MGKSAPGEAAPGAAPVLPARSAFAVPQGYLNSASRHPLSIAAADAIAAYSVGLAAMDPAATRMSARRSSVRDAFARLINARPDEIAFVPSTVFAENMLLTALSLGGASDGVVTDRLHFFGSLYLYERRRRAGMPVTVLDPIDGRIPVDAVDAAITSDTKLVAVSLVSASNGFEHDLAAVCDRAHAMGALVYADIIQAAGATPIDVRASGVDFAACATYKWLMGDMGLGFLYVRGDRMERLKAPMVGQDQLTGTVPFVLDAAALADRSQRTGAAGLFEVGTLSHSALAALDQSLALIESIGVDRIAEYRQPLLTAIRDGLTRVGLRLMTPPETRSAIIAFDAGPQHAALAHRFTRAGIKVTWRDSILRIAPSLFNDMHDIDLLIEAATDA